MAPLRRSAQRSAPPRHRSGRCYGAVRRAAGLRERGRAPAVVRYGTKPAPRSLSAGSSVSASGLQALTDGSSYTLTTNVSDAAGNAATENTGTSFTYDITAPTISDSVAISSASGVQNSLLNAGDNVSVTATFSESVIVDNASGNPELTLVVGSYSREATYASVDNSTTLVFQYTIRAGDNDTNGISIGENALDLNGGTISDPAGNNATLTHSSVDNNSSYMVDTTAPTVDNFTITDTKLLVGETMTVNLGFSEKVIEFIAADINLDNATGALPSMASSDNRTWSGTFTPTADSEDASNTLSLTTSSYTDPAGNAGPSAITSNYEVETLAPTASFSFTDYHLEPGETATVSLVFSEVVDNFSRVEDITVPDLDNGTTSGTLTAMTSSDNRTWTGTFTPTFSNDNATGTQDWTNTLSLATGYTDTAGNTGTAATSPNYMVDEIDPYLKSFTLSDTELKAGETATVTLVFSEPVANLELADITADNGSLTNLDSNDNNTIWTVTFTPDDDTVEDNNTISLAASWTDTVGNDAGTDNTTSNYEIETERPSVISFTFSVVQGTTFTNANNIVEFPALKPGDNATVSLEFSEEVFSFSAADISHSNVDFAEMISIDNKSWSGTFTPTDNKADLTNTLRLKKNSFTDIAGNYGSQTFAKWLDDNTTTNYVVDTGGAAVTSFSPSNNNVCIPVTENIIVTFNFPMDTSEITADESTGCGATIQVSSDNFSNLSCVAMPGEPVASTSSSLPTNPSYNTNMTFTLDPVDNLAYDTTYKIKVTGGADADPDKAVKSALRNILSTQYVSSFRTYPAPSSVSGLFMAVGSSGKILRSTDNGSSWDIANCQFATNLADVTFGNNTYVAVFDNGTTIRSTDNGSSFSIISYEEDLNGVTFGNNTFVAVGDSGKIVRSTDNGSSWDNATSGISQYLNGITFGNNTFVGVGSGGKIVRSTDNGTNWDNATSPIETYLNGATFSE